MDCCWNVASRFARGVIISKSLCLEDADNKLSGAFCVLLTQLQLEMQYLQRQIDGSDKLILRIADELEDCRRLLPIPGIGPMTATATIAAIGNGSAF